MSLSARNRGNSRFKPPQRTRVATDSTNEEEEYYDEDDTLNRSYRPKALADLSSLTSADIVLGENNARRHIRRRPSTTTSTTTARSSPEIRIGSRLPTARKNFQASLETVQKSRRLGLSTTTEGLVERPSTIFRTFTPPDNIEDKTERQYATIVRSRFLVNEEQETETETEKQLGNEVTDNPVEDSTGYETDNEYKTAEPEITTEAELRTRRILKRIRSTTPIPSSTQESEINTSTEFNRSALRRRRPIIISNKDEQEEIKLSETNISDGTRVGINGVQDGEKTQRRRKKIIRKIGPATRTENILKEEVTSEKIPVVIRTRNGRFQNTGTDNILDESKEGEFKAIRINQNTEGTPDDKPQRQRKVIRLRLKPASSTTTSTTSVEDENEESTTFESNYTTELDETTLSFEEETDATDETTTEELTTTTTTTTARPRSTVASLTGRPRPAYRPRGRTPTTPDTRSTTSLPAAYRRRNTLRTISSKSTTVALSSTSEPTTITTVAPTSTTNNEQNTISDTTSEKLTTLTIEDLIETTLSSEEKDIKATIFEEETTTNLPSTQPELIETTTEELLNTELEVSTENLEKTTIALTVVPSLITEKSTTETTPEISTTTVSSTTQVYKPTRYRPGDRPKIRFQPNRQQEQQSTTEENRTRGRFIPARPAEQRPRISFRRDNITTDKPRTTSASTNGDNVENNRSPFRKFQPQGRKLEPKYNQDSNGEQEELETDAEIESDVPINEVNENIGHTDETARVRRPNQPAVGKIPTRNYTRKFSNKPVYVTTPSTTTVQAEILNARNKQLFSNPRKMNIPQKTSTEEVTTSETTGQTLLEFTVTEEPTTTTEHWSTLHHVFAEIISETDPSSTTEMDMTESYTAVPHIDRNKLERLVEVNRIVEVSLKEEKLKNNSRVTVLEPSPVLNKIARVGAINRLTVINVVDGNGSVNHATLEDILTGRKIFSSSKSNITSDEASTTTPTDTETKLNILNNTLEIIEADKKFEIFSRSNVVDYSPKVADPIASAIPKLGAAPIIDSVSSTNGQTDKGNNLDDQDLLESANGRVRVRIVGKEPSYAPIVADSQETATLKAVVVEVPQKPDEIRIAPIKVSIGP